MEKLHVNEAVLQSIFCEASAFSELSAFLNDAITGEIGKGDSMDCDLIDLCVDALGELQQESGNAAKVLTVLLSEEKFLKAVQKHSVLKYDRYKKLTAVCAAAALLFAASGMFAQTSSGERLTKQISNKIAAIFTAEPTTIALPDEPDAPAPPTEPSSEFTTEPLTESPTEPIQAKAKEPVSKKTAEILPDRIYGIFPNDLKTEYNVGESLDMHNVRVMAVWSDGRETEIPLSECDVTTTSGFSRDPGRYSITVFYKGLSFSYAVTVDAEKNTLILNSIYGTFREGFSFTVDSFDNIDFSGMTVIAVYSDGSEAEIPPDECIITVEENFMELQNKALVTVTYQDRAFSFILTKAAQ